MSKHEIIVSDLVNAQDQQRVGRGLNASNDEITGYNDRRPLAELVRDPVARDVLGGATGRSSLGLLFLDLFYLPDALRGSGVGSTVLKAFEKEGRGRGCVAGMLYTISVQAPGVYQRHGWERFGEIACAPRPGTSRIFLTMRF